MRRLIEKISLMNHKSKIHHIKYSLSKMSLLLLSIQLTLIKLNKKEKDKKSCNLIFIGISPINIASELIFVITKPIHCNQLFL